MMNNLKNTKIKRFLSLGLVCAGFVLIGGSLTNVNAQTSRDPFAQPEWAKPRNTNPNPNSGKGKVNSTNPNGAVPTAVFTAPPIEQRINYYKSIRESAAANGLELPKVTSVLTLDELSVIGIFRTPRGYAAMVEAKPINLSYTIYPGEKFFDGQLVAIEDNRLVFRKITKTGSNKFTSSVENKTLRQFTVEQEVNGTAPNQPTAPGGRTEEQSNTVVAPNTNNPSTNTAPSLVISPLEEMNRQPAEPVKTAKEKETKKGKKTVKVANNKKDDNQK